MPERPKKDNQPGFRAQLGKENHLTNWRLNTCKHIYNDIWMAETKPCSFRGIFQTRKARPSASSSRDAKVKAIGLKSKRPGQTNLVRRQKFSYLEFNSFCGVSCDGVFCDACDDAWRWLVCPAPLQPVIPSMEKKRTPPASELK